MRGGEYDNAGRPVITASVLLPEFEIGQEISFLIDTGADGTSLSGLDAVQAGLTPEHLGQSEFDEVNISGVTDTTGWQLTHPTMLAFEAYSETHDRYSLHIETLPEISILPKCRQSLLGRDFLDRFDVSFNAPAETVTLNRHDYAGGPYTCIPNDEEIAPSMRDFEESGNPEDTQ